MHPLASYRRAKGLTQTDLAQKLGVSLPTVQRWEAGSIPRARQVPKLADALGVPAEELDRAIRGWKIDALNAETAKTGAA